MSAWMPLRVHETPVTPKERLADAARRIERIKLLAEGAESQLDELRGCEINRDDVLEVLGMIVEQAEAIKLPQRAAKEQPR